MFRKFLLTLAACMPIALSGCGGGSSPAPEPSSPSDSGSGSMGDTSETLPEDYQRRVTDLNITHVESTDYVSSGGRDEVVCSDSVSQVQDPFGGGTELAGCTVTASEGPAIPTPIPVNDYVEVFRGASDLSNGFSSLVPGGKINGVELAVKSIDLEDSEVLNVIGGIGRYSGFGTSRVYDANDRITLAFSYAFGERTAMRPSEILPSETFRATWRGAMVGISISDSGPALAGKVVLTYEVADNMVDVDISNVRSYDDVSYTGPSSFSWSDLQVQSDGEFHQAGSQNNHISGSFYGSKTDEEFGQGEVESAVFESAGVFEHNSVVGAWLAVLRESDNANPASSPAVPTTGGPELPSTPGN